MTITRKSIVLFLLAAVLMVTACIGCKKETATESEKPEPAPVAETEKETAATPEPGLLERLTVLDLEQEGSGEALQELVEELPADEVDKTITELERELEKRPEAVEIICTLSLLYQRAGKHKQEYEMITRLQAKEKSGVRIPSTLKFVYGRAPALEDELGITAARLMEEIEGLIGAEKYEAALEKLNSEKELLPPDWRTETIARVNELIAERDAAIAAAKAAEERVPPLTNFVLVKAGTFTMGSPTNEKDRYSDERQHTVRISKDFYISKYEVTQGEYRSIMGTNPSDTDGGLGNNNPVNRVSWYDAVEYCNKRSEREGLTPAYTINGNNVTWNKTANGYRLPTEAEWEYAARGGQKAGSYNIYAGSDNIDNVAWYISNSGGKTHPIGQKQANELGIYDMTGNVWEWCWDWYGDYPSGSVTDPSGPSSGEYRVLRGGSWDSYNHRCRAAARLWLGSVSSDNSNGFRLLLPSTR